MLTVTTLTKRYKQLTAVDSVSFHIPRGTVAGIVGVNGAGKSTLLKMLVTLTKPDTGTVALEDCRYGTSGYRSCLFYLPEQFTPHPFLTGREAILYPLGMYGAEPSDDALSTMTSRFGLTEDDLRKTAGKLSKGTRQKLGLAAAFLSPAPLLVLDEPMSGLDPVARARFRETVTLAKGAGRTVLFASHVLSDVERICDTVIALHKGAVRFDGTPAAFLQQEGATHMEDAFLKRIGEHSGGAV